MPHQKKISDVNVLVQEYLAGASSYELAEKYKTSAQCILNWLRKGACEIRPLGDSAKLRFKKFGHPMSGREVSQETRSKMRENHADVSGDRNPNFGKGLHGEQNPNWRGGICKERQPGGSNGRWSAKAIAWKRMVLIRDGFQCQLCKSTNKRNLVTHHLRNWGTHEALRFEVDNGITLCNKCHGSVSWNEGKYVPLFEELVRLKK